MKLNCDLGESFGSWQKGADQAIMPLIDLANIACGFHASDPLTMLKTVQLAKQHQVTIGAHPSYPDLIGFGRRSMTFSAPELTAIIQYQIGALHALCLSNDTVVSYVKPHGALYNDMMKDLQLFNTVCASLSSITALNTSPLPLIIQAIPDTHPFEEIAQRYGLTLWFEAFADRAYQDNGFLVPRSDENAVIHETEQVVNRCNHLLTTGKLLSINGKELSLNVDTLCVHSDTPSAVDLVVKLRILLDEKIDKKDT